MLPPLMLQLAKHLQTPSIGTARLQHSMYALAADVHE